MAIINFKKNFIFIHPRRTGGGSLLFALLKYCDDKDIVSDDVIRENLSSLSESMPIYQNELKKIHIKKFNFSGYINFFASFIKILPFINSIFKFNHPPNFKFPKLFEKKINLYTHSSISNVKNIVSDKFFENAFKFTIVRNPYDQILSFYSAYHKEKNFKKFIKEESSYFFNRETELVFLKNKLPYNKIIKYENLENDLKHLSELLNLPENIFEVFKTLKIGRPSKKDYSIVDSESQKIIYKNAFNFFKEFNYNENI